LIPNLLRARGNSGSFPTAVARARPVTMGSFCRLWSVVVVERRVVQCTLYIGTIHRK
jgi:hypothetical protein